MESLGEIIQERGIEAFGRFYSTYRAVVMSNEDPEKTGKILVHLPTVYNVIRWAFPKGQHGGPNTGFKYLTPPVNSIVYVEFENGDPAHPLWSYHGWAIDENPEELLEPNTMGWVTPKGNKVYLSEEDGVLKIVTRGGTSVKMVIPNEGDKEDKAEVTLDVNSNGVQVNSSKDITLDCKGNITINRGENKGLINIEELTDKLNNLVKEVKALTQVVNTHVHTSSPPGNPTTPSTTQAQNPSDFNKDDYEDTKVTH